MSDQTITYTFNWWLEFVQEHDDSALASKLHLQNERIAKLEGANRHLHTLIQENMGVRNEFQNWDDYEPPVAANKQETE